MATDIDRLLQKNGQYQHPAALKYLVMDVLAQAEGQLTLIEQRDSMGRYVLQIYGMISTTVLRQDYNTQINMWLPYNFPHEAPTLYVIPTNDMKIPLHHENISANGRVQIPMLDSWSADSSLAILLVAVSSVFVKKPPLVRVPKGRVTPTFQQVMTAIQKKKAQMKRTLAPKRDGLVVCS